jgi:UDP-sulfoquinovose synthase
LENPPKPGEYRVFNQFEEVYGINELAEKVQRVGRQLGLDVELRNVENPRQEMEDHYYNPDHANLFNLGYRPTHAVEDELRTMLVDLMKYRSTIESRRHVLVPDVRWNGRRERVRWLDASPPRTSVDSSVEQTAGEGE